MIFKINGLPDELEPIGEVMNSLVQAQNVNHLLNQTRTTNHHPDVRPEVRSIVLAIRTLIQKYYESNPSLKLTPSNDV